LVQEEGVGCVDFRGSDRAIIALVVEKNTSDFVRSDFCSRLEQSFVKMANINVNLFFEYPSVFLEFHKIIRNVKRYARSL
jgi:hypothetical protein